MGINLTFSVHILREYGDKITEILHLELNAIIHKTLGCLSLGWTQNSTFGDICKIVLGRDIFGRVNMGRKVYAFIQHIY